MSGSGRGSLVRYHPYNRINLEVCSFCRRYFTTPQALGTHLLVHRREITERQERRQLLTAIVEAYYRARFPRQENVSRIPIELLTPNHAFWEAYRRQNQTPPTINFMGVPDDEGAEEGDKDRDTEETITDPLVARTRVERGEEASSSASMNHLNLQL